MRRQPKVLLATADPLLNQQLARMGGVTPIGSECETPGHCLRQATLQDVEWVVISPALAPDAGMLAALVAKLKAMGSGVQCLVLVGPGQLSAQDVRAVCAAGGKVVVPPAGETWHWRTLLQSEWKENPDRGGEARSVSDVSGDAKPSARPLPDGATDQEAETLDLPFGGREPSAGDRNGDLHSFAETCHLNQRNDPTVRLEEDRRASARSGPGPGPDRSASPHRTAWAGNRPAAEGSRPFETTEPLLWAASVSGTRTGRSQPSPVSVQAPRRRASGPGIAQPGHLSLHQGPPQEVAAEPGAEAAPAYGSSSVHVAGEGRAVLRQRVVAFWGGKPGTGRSTLLVAVSDLISRMPGVRVCSVDLNPQNSSLAPLLRKESEPNSWWRLGEALVEGNLTPQAVRESLIGIRPGWSLLSGPAGSDQWCALLTGRVVADLVALLRAEFDYILLDLPAGRGPVADAGFAHAQQVILTVSAFFPDVVDTARQFQQLVADGIATRERCCLVLAPWIDSAELPAADVGACLGLPVSATVPLAPVLAMAAARVGQPITQLGSAEARSYTQAATVIAALITGRSVERPQRRIWFGR